MRVIQGLKIQKIRISYPQSVAFVALEESGWLATSGVEQEPGPFSS
jgi:hypothetical protein